ncbi:7-carboxy-7-deazaguanine synthase QueE [Candidatus Uabimicrobium amorphum]|uniref:7-carboxy-7-deazaguanine synthase n=1 Tax=Uabimicrobium amorphum TaxID=2596890 RepID=A0A5S9IJJ2_UABAM|nr:7-carboxy-7-deazaguanine synthase QueE [Candidatus Uabimicrobium amorphum]BBM82616.1 7-carboxy-7-deazaguanine synthase [Candidatus Uabimicrobium amorphum]
MWISEIFYTVQGEGILLGVPSVFVRTSGCNLRCAWCDTKYTSWNASGQHINVEDVLKKVMSFPCDHVVLTGGEPLLDKDITTLTHLLHQENKHITIETAATIFNEDIICDLASLSPKLSNSKPQGLSEDWIQRHEKQRLQPQIINKWIEKYDYQLKFVVSEKNDLQEILQLLESLTNVTRQNVVLMPEGTQAAALYEKSIWLTEVCKEYGFRYTPRMHIDLFGNKRGV